MEITTEDIAAAEAALVTFYAGIPVEQISKDQCIRFAALLNKQLLLLPVNTVSLSAVNVMCQTMADNKTEELLAARNDTRQALITTLTSLADECQATGDPDEAGIRRALLVLERSV